MIKVITLIITLLFYSEYSSQSDSISSKMERLNVIFLDENNNPKEKTIHLTSESNNITIELKSDVNGIIDTLIPTNNTYTIHLINKPNDEKVKSDLKPIKKHEDILSIVGLILNFIVKGKGK